MAELVVEYRRGETPVGRSNITNAKADGERLLLAFVLAFALGFGSRSFRALGSP